MDCVSPQVLVIGSRSQIGRGFLGLLGERALGLGREELDLRKPEELEGYLKRRPIAVICCAAHTAVDLAESEPGLAREINAVAPGIFARLCARYDIPFVHFSTEYVYGDRDPVAPHVETEEPAPLNAYGASKLEGERAVIAAGGRHLIFRTSWVYDSAGKNFLLTMLRLARARGEGGELRVVDDQVGCPNYAPDLAKMAWQGLERALGEAKFPSGVYHLGGEAGVSWAVFAREILERAHSMGLLEHPVRVQPITTAEYPTPARRPKNSRISMARARGVLGIVAPEDWREPLKRCLERVKSGIRQAAQS